MNSASSRTTRFLMTGRGKMVDVLVTGGAGFIGSNFVRFALERHPDWRVTTLDKLTYAGRRENLHDVLGHPRHRFVHGDIADAKAAAPLVEESEVVVHFAAETHVDRSILAAGEFIHTDVFGTFVLLEAARRAPRLRRFVQISTDEVYGSVAEGASRETDELKPRNPYAASKAAADRLAYSYWATYDLPVLVTRASNNYGPYQFPEKIILDLLGKPVTLIKPVQDRPGHDRRYCLDTSKLRALGWTPHIAFGDGLASTVEWYRRNEWWWRPI
jgi:dTDP-glucose 4,6-dehydratase